MRTEPVMDARRATLRPGLAMSETCDLVLPLSARDPDVLAVMRSRLAAYLRATPDVDVASVSFTLSRARASFPWRCAVVGADAIAMAGALEALPGSVASQRARGLLGPTPVQHPAALVFALPDSDGLVGHHDRSCAAFPEGRRWLDEAERVLGAPLPAEAPPDAGAFTLQVAAARQLEAWGVTPDAWCGEGIGELTVAVLSGLLDFDEGLALAVRGPHDADRSSLLVIEAGVERTRQQVTAAPVSVAAVTVDEHLVVSGALPDLRRLARALERDGVVTRLLPGHGLEARDAQGEEIPGSLGLVQLAAGHRRPLVADLGPGDGFAGDADVIASPRAGALPALVTVLADLWCHGIDADPALGRTGRRLRLPGYAFRRPADVPPKVGRSAGEVAPDVTSTWQHLFGSDPPKGPLPMPLLDRAGLGRLRQEIRRSWGNAPGIPVLRAVRTADDLEDAIRRCLAETGLRTTDRGLPSRRPLTAAMQRLLFHELVRTGGRDENNLIARALIDPEPRIPVLHSVFRWLQARHASLRSCMHREGEGWFWLEFSEPVADLDVVNVGAAEDPAAARARAVSEMAARPFAMLDAPLVRALVTEGGPGPQHLALVAHRAIVEPAALNAMLDTMLAEYAHRTSSAHQGVRA